MQMAIKVQQQDFNLGAEVAKLRAAAPGAGAVVAFVGLVRDMDSERAITALELEHYPEMTERMLAEIVAEAEARWELAAAHLIHRVGRLAAQEQIVMVAVASAHRHDAFAACEFIMDYLKTRAPFWKKEDSSGDADWVQQQKRDRSAASRWECE